MTSPAIFSLVADTWTIVATNVARCRVDVRDVRPKYVYTYVDTGQPAPTDDTYSLPIHNECFIINVAANADIYVKSIAAAGKVQASYGLIT